MSRADRAVRPGWTGASIGEGRGRSRPEWNVVATVRTGELNRGKSLLERFGDVFKTDYFNVLVLVVEDVAAFLDDYAARARADPRLSECVARVAPAFATFDFASPEEFEAEARAAAAAFAPKLGGKAFHVRMNRRGFKHAISSQTEEQLLDGVLLEELGRRGAPGRITFDDPDAILDIETVDGRGGMSLWTREDLERYPFLKVD